METEILLKHRILFLSEEINAQTSNRLISQLLLLDADDSEQRIDFYINSPGGAVSDGLAIIDTIRCIQAPVSTICLGKAFSMAAWILAAGMKGQRYATPHSEMMIHQLAAGFQGEAGDIEVYARRILRQQEQLIAMFSQWTGRPVEQIRTDMERDFFLTAEEAKAYGLIDELLEPFQP